MQTQFGQTVVDVVTGFRGVATGKVSYQTGCNQTLVVPKINEKGEKPAGEWIDDDRLQVDLSVPIIELTRPKCAPVVSAGPDMAPPTD